MTTGASVPAARSARVWRRTKIGASLVAAVAVLLWLVDTCDSRWLVLGIGGALLVLCIFEVDRMGAWGGKRLGLCLALAALAAFAVRVQVPAIQLGMLAAIPVAGIAAWILSPSRSAQHAGAVMAIAAWLVTLLGLEPLWSDWGTRGLVALLLLSKIGDTAGYYAGNAFGRHHPFPTISPGKTVEGCCASLLAGTAVGAAAVALGLLPSEPYGLIGGLAAGAAINLAAQAGDLLESWVKRRAGVKDSGTWFGPAGGVLDQVDSLLLTIPVALWLWPRLFALPAP